MAIFPLFSHPRSIRLPAKIYGRKQKIVSLVIFSSDGGEGNVGEVGWVGSFAAVCGHPGCRKWQRGRQRRVPRRLKPQQGVRAVSGNVGEWQPDDVPRNAVVVREREPLVR